MQGNEIVDFWGIENLNRWNVEDLEDLDVSESAKRFLSDVGLPKQSDWTLRLGEDRGSLPRLKERPTCRVIGYDDYVPICVDEENDGRIIEVERWPSSVRVINSSVQHFGAALVQYQRYRIEVQSVGEDHVEAFIDEIEKMLKEIDTAAYSAPGAWWPLIIEQMRDGLL